MRAIKELHQELKRVTIYNGLYVPEYGSMSKAEIIDLLLEEILLFSKMCGL